MKISPTKLRKRLLNLLIAERKLLFGGKWGAAAKHA